MVRPVRVIKAGPPELSGPPPDDDPKDWETAWNYAQNEPDSMSMEGLGGEEVIPYMNETELKDGANKWNYINPGSPNPYRIELNRRIVGHQAGTVVPFETADSRDFVNEMERRERGGEGEEWRRAAREDQPIPEGAEYQHSLRTVPDVDLQTDMYQQMMQNDPLNPTFTAGEPMDLAFRLLKALSAEDLEQASRTGGLRQTPERQAAYREAGVPYGAPPMLPSGTQRNAERIMAEQTGELPDDNWPYGDIRHAWEDDGQYQDSEDESNYNFSQRDVESMTSGPSMPDPHTEPEPETVGRSEVIPSHKEYGRQYSTDWAGRRRYHWEHEDSPGIFYSHGRGSPPKDQLRRQTWLVPAGQPLSEGGFNPLFAHNTIPEHTVQHRTERMPQHPSDFYSAMPDYRMLEEGPQGQALAALHQRQQHRMSEAGQREEQERIEREQREEQERMEREASLKRQEEQRMAETRQTPSAATSNLPLTEEMMNPQAAAMEKLRQRQAATIARQKAMKDSLEGRRRRKFSRRR